MASTERRGQARKSQTGCITCRIRRIKCDEDKPQCDRCHQSGVLCDGYTDIPLSRPKLIEITRAITADGHRGPATNFLDQYLPSNVTRASSERRDAVTGNDAPRASIVPVRMQPGRSRLDPASDVGHLGLTAQESSHFDFFRSRTVPMTRKLLGSEFWARIVLQAGHDEPAVKHAILALSALHRRSEITMLQRRPVPAGAEASVPAMLVVDQSSTARIAWRREELRRFATTQYNKAVKAAQRLLEQGDNVAAILVVCIIFVCYSNLIGQYHVGQVHLASGQNILVQQKQTIAEGRGGSRILSSQILRAISEVFSRIDFQAMTFSESTAPYQYARPEVLEDARPVDPDTLDILNIGEAFGYIMDHIRWFFSLFNAFGSGTLPPEVFYRMHDHAARNFKQWTALLNNFETEDTTEEDKEKLLLIRLYYITILTIVDAGPYGLESRWDQFEDRFERIIELSTQILYGFAADDEVPFDEDPSKRPQYSWSTTTLMYSWGSTTLMKSFFTLEPGIVIPLFLTMMRCRHPLLRRKALALLRASHRVEGVWDSLGAAAVGERIMKMEEEGIYPVAGATELGPAEFIGPPIPEVKRVHMVFVTVDVEGRKVNMTTLLKPQGLEGDWDMRDNVVYW